MLRRLAIIALIALLLLPAAALAASEVYGLQYMREEEKLARDEYLALYATWKMPVFSNIAASEQRHMDAVLTLLTSQGVADPAVGNGPGVFANETIQALFTSLMGKGVLSRMDALEVGVIVEVTDIEDLDEALAATSRADLRTVYTNLRTGSCNHLDACSSLLSRYRASPIFLAACLVPLRRAGGSLRQSPVPSPSSSRMAPRAPAGTGRGGPRAR